MKLNPMLFFVLALLGLWVCGCVYMIFFERRKESLRLRLVAKLGACLMLVGSLAFFGQCAVKVGGLVFLGPSFEWPVGWATGVVRDSQGRYIVPVHFANRIQVYDPDGKFLHGWWIDGSSYDFALRIAKENAVEAYVARNDQRLLYSPEGRLLERTGISPNVYNQVYAENTFSKYFPTPWILWPLTNPFYALAVAGIGFALRFILDRRNPARNTGLPMLRSR